MTNPTTYAHEPVAPTIIGDPLRSTGLTKRELFAAMAMQGMLADHERDHSFSENGEIAVKFADALIAALNQ